MEEAKQAVKIASLVLFSFKYCVIDAPGVQIILLDKVLISRRYRQLHLDP